MKLDKEALGNLIKLGVFLALTGLATFVLMSILANGLFSSRREYKAVFEDVTGVSKGDDVRIAGVMVGAINKVEVTGRDKAMITFGVNSDVSLTQNTAVTIKFRNLIGQRYLALTQGSEGSKSVLRPGSTIPLSRTQEALDLNVLLNGFKPVFQALSPADTNKFAFEIVQVLQGESGNVENLLSSTSSLTNTLADRDQLIGSVITNLSETLDTLGSRDQQLSDTIVTLQQFVTGLKDDRGAILNSIDSVSALSNETSDLLVQGRPALVDDIKQLNAATRKLSTKKNITTLSQGIQILPFKMKKLTNAAASGSQFNFYLCTLKGTIELPAIPGLLSDPVTLRIGGGQGVDVGGARCEAS